MYTCAHTHITCTWIRTHTYTHTSMRVQTPCTCILHTHMHVHETTRTQKQRCPLHQAVVKGHLKVVEALLRYDPKLIECADGVVSHVICCNISCDLFPQKRMQPLHLALKHHSPAIAFNLLSQQKCPVTSTDVVSQVTCYCVLRA